MAGSARRAPLIRPATQAPIALARNAPNTLNAIVANGTSAHLRTRASTAFCAPTASEMRLKSTAATSIASAPAHTALQSRCQPRQLASHDVTRRTVTGLSMCLLPRTASKSGCGGLVIRRQTMQTGCQPGCSRGQVTKDGQPRGLTVLITARRASLLAAEEARYLEVVCFELALRLRRASVRHGHGLALGRPRLD